MRPRGRAVSGGEEEREGMGVNNTSLPTPRGQGQSTIWPGGARWLGTPPHSREHLVPPRHWEHGTLLGVAAKHINYSLQQIRCPSSYKTCISKQERTGTG